VTTSALTVESISLALTGAGPVFGAVLTASDSEATWLGGSSSTSKTVASWRTKFRPSSGAGIGGRLSTESRPEDGPVYAAEHTVIPNEVIAPHGCTTWLGGAAAATATDAS
jgi:hypothetical protein